MTLKPLAAVSILLLAAGLTFAEPATQPSTQPAAVEKITIDQFDKLSADGEHVILDVRTPQEFADGHVAGAVNVPFTKTGFEASLAALDKSKPYLVYCHSGKRSFLATQRMQATGFDHLQNFAGGIAAWENAGKPMETKPAATQPS